MTVTVTVTTTATMTVTALRVAGGRYRVFVYEPAEPGKAAAPPKGIETAKAGWVQYGGCARDRSGCDAGVLPGGDRGGG